MTTPHDRFMALLDFVDTQPLMDSLESIRMSAERMKSLLFVAENSYAGDDDGDEFFSSLAAIKRQLEAVDKYLLQAEELKQ